MKSKIAFAGLMAALCCIRPASAEHIFVKTAAGKNLDIDIDADKSVLDLKNLVADKEGIPADQQHLIFAGRELDDDKTLADYNIAEDSQVHLVLVMRGH